MLRSYAAITSVYSLSCCISVVPVACFIVRETVAALEVAKSSDRESLCLLPDSESLAITIVRVVICTHVQYCAQGSSLPNVVSGH